MKRFVRPVWSAPVDADAIVASTPETGTISGIFPAAIIAGVQKRHITLASARERYVAFSYYPQREHAQLLREAAQVLYPAETLRQGLRILGHHGPRVLMDSPLGKAVLGGAQSVHQTISAVARSYPVNVKTCHVDVIETAARHAIVRLSKIHYFLDCHHVGVFEGALQLAGVMGEVLINVTAPGEADFLVRW